jgi:hypothetical protein
MKRNIKAIGAGIVFGTILFIFVLRPLGAWPVFQDEQLWLWPVLSLVALGASSTYLWMQYRTCGKWELLTGSFWFNSGGLIIFPTVSWQSNRPIASDHLFAFLVFATWSVAIAVVSWFVIIIASRLFPLAIKNEKGSLT